MQILQTILKFQRKIANLTQQEVAKKANISFSLYSDLEHGRCNPSLKTFTKLAAILDFDMNILKAHAFDD